jgi:hypothetical protein
MAKTQAAATITVDGREFTTNAVPDPFDLRDLDYRSMLRPLPPRLPRAPIDPLDPAFRVLAQEGQSCTGHAVAALINAIGIRQAAELDLPEPEPVSPYMVYRLARRYDEFAEEADIGSSLRGAFKGWLRHGIALDREWAALAAVQGTTPLEADVDLDDPDFQASCRLRPLGAYYRVNPYRLDDMQSAINELHGIAASAAIHTGWSDPVPLERAGDAPIWLIKRSANPEPAGGHAFAIVGYNEIGFVIQNSWGRGWGGDGFAILTYEDWLESAYDAWVARPGVPNTPFAAEGSRTRVTTGGDIVVHGGPNLTLLRNYVVNTGNDGRLSDLGRFTSSVAQVDAMFDNLAAKHADWTSSDGTAERHVMLYAHGGLVDEENGLKIAERQLGWWLSSHVYPINFVWQSGGIETILGALADLTKVRLPSGGLGFDLEEHWDRLVERTSRRLFSGLWEQMKANGDGASAKVAGDVRGATLVAERLRAYAARHGAANVRIHLAGHSAGTIFLSALGPRLVASGLRIESMAFLGGAVRSDEFERRVLPHLRAGRIGRFTTFNLSERAEQDDSCPAGPITVYHKSLLYLVARGLERRSQGDPEAVPLVGLEKALDLPLTRSRGTLRSAIEDRRRGRVVIAPGGTEPDLRSDARDHGGFDDDRATMTSVLLRALDRKVPPAGPYRANMPLTSLAAAPSAGDQAAIAAAFDAALAESGAGTADQAAAAGADDAGAAGDGTRVRVPTEAALSPKTDSPTLDVLLANRWREVVR